MTTALAAVVALACGLAAGWFLPPHGRRPRRERVQPVRKILVPFTGTAISRRALEAAVRLSKAENAKIMPAFLARVPRNMPLDAPLPVQCTSGMGLLEAIDQRASAQGIVVDSRVGRGRTYRDALRQILAAEDFDRIIISASDSPYAGLTIDDMEWLLEKVPAEVMILRPAATDERRISAGESLAGHF